jgi:hypothetical protein
MNCFVDVIETLERDDQVAVVERHRIITGLEQHKLYAHPLRKAGQESGALVVDRRVGVVAGQEVDERAE